MLRIHIQTLLQERCVQNAEEQILIINKMSFEIVVARYEEDVQWLLPVASNTIIYNKGTSLPPHIASQFKNVIVLPNVGRESYTYLYHIIETYESLADVTVFTQARIDDHVKLSNTTLPTLHAYLLSLKDQAIIHGVSKNARHHLEVGSMSSQATFNLSPYYHTGLNRSTEPNLGMWLQNVIKFAHPGGTIPWYKNALFAAQKINITQHPTSYYKDLLMHVSNIINPEAAHYFERSWYVMFAKSPPQIL